MSVCRSCGAQIRWTLTVANQKRMPVDAEPVVGGNVVITTGEEARVLSKADTVRRAGDGEKLFVSHYSTCPEAGAWRKLPPTTAP